MPRAVLASRPSFCRSLLSDKGIREQPCGTIAILPEAAGKIAIVPHGCSRIPLSERSDRQNDGREARTALGIPAGKTVASFVGSIRPYKGLDALIAAFAAVRRDLPDALLLVAGQ